MSRNSVPRSIPPEVGSARGRVAVYVRDRRPAEEIQAARDDLAAAKLEAHIRRLVDAAPPLSETQLERLAQILGLQVADAKAAARAS